MPPAFDSTPHVISTDGSVASGLIAGGRIGAVVEVCPDAGDRLPIELIASAYRASRSALMVLVCHGASREAVDAALTPTVQEVGLDVHGVLYLDGDDVPAVWEAVRRAPVVVAATDRFRERLNAWGVPFVDPGEAVPSFERWSNGAAAA